MLIGTDYYVASKRLGFKSSNELISPTDQTGTINEEDQAGILENDLHPLSIEKLRSVDFPGSEIKIEETLTPRSNYKRYIASYRSEGLKIYALLTIPNADPPTEAGYPVIIFNHGFIQPAAYRTTEKYIAYVDGFARNGYIVFRPDYRGHGNSEGNATGAYGSSAYTIDVANAVSSVKKLESADPNNIGMWGHSMGGHITLRNMVVSKDIKAGVIWAGVVGSYQDLLERWRRRPTSVQPTITGRSRWRADLVERYGQPDQNPQFWNSISANSYLTEISGPLQLHHGTSDQSVPVEFSEKLEAQMIAAGKEVELYKYPGDDHNISKNFSTAMRRSIEFFDKFLKE